MIFKFRRDQEPAEGIDRMLRDIEREVAATRYLTGKKAFSPKVMNALRQVPRHDFIQGSARARAYDNGPVRIGHGQTISQPYIVGLMTDLLCADANHVVLEVGTGCGYQAAVLARIVKRVYTLEIIPELGEQAAARLRRLGYGNIEARTGDGYYGWPEHAPFDGIIVTAAAPRIPPPLVDQLKPGGRLVVPVGLPYMPQDLMVIEKDETGMSSIRNVLGVAFVPLTGRHDGASGER